MPLSEALAEMMEYGPVCIRVGLLVMCAYHLWQRNIVRSIISLGACMATFILGW